MQKLFDEVGSLDERCYKEFALSEDILMEHAAEGMAHYIRENFQKKSKVLIVCGSGNNGADGIALSRLLYLEYDVKLFYIKSPKSKMAILQAKRSKSIGVLEVKKPYDCDVVVDAIVGTGFRGEFDENLSKTIKKLNRISAFKIACDIPSGISPRGICAENTFKADITLTMGALKKSMFLDEAKEFVGNIQVVDLGVSRDVYEKQSNWYLLEQEDLELPFRKNRNTHKGSFGHLVLICGEKKGASIMSGLSALRFGSGLVTLVGYEKEQTLQVPHSLMYSHKLPSNATALACGMGLGYDFSDTELKEFLDNSLPLIIDADIFYMKTLLKILQRKELVITPHPKEFISLLSLTGIANIQVEELQKNRFKYAEKFCAKYPNVVLLLKGSNVIIGKKDTFFINNYGISSLAKGGSGDVLSGLVGALLAQGQSALKATINASLAHTKLALHYKGADFSLTPDDLIAGIGNL